MSVVELFTTDQEEIRSVARRFLESEAGSVWLRNWIDTDGAGGDQLWSELAELGWLGIAISAEHGGAGYGFVERAILLEEMGRVLLPLPFFSTAAVAVDLLAALGTDPALDCLRGLAEGARRAAVVSGGDMFARRSAGQAVTAEERDGRWLLDGTAGATLDAAGAGLLLVAADCGDSTGIFLIDADRDGVTHARVELLDATRPTADLEFAGARGTRLDDGADAAQILERTLDQAGISLAAEMIGGAERCLELTVAYVKDREQFGVPIGSFQALKHRLSDLHIVVDAARELVYAAARAAAEGEASREFAAAAKAAADGAFLRATEETIQMHGGIGFTWEHDAHLFYKRALVAASMFGSTTEHLDLIAAALGV